MASTGRTQTTDPHLALAGALRAIANGDGTAVRDAEEIPAVGSTITVTLPTPLTLSVIEHAGMEQRYDEQGWRTQDGRESPEPHVAVTDALVAIAEDDLAAGFIETDKDRMMACPLVRPTRLA